MENRTLPCFLSIGYGSIPKWKASAWSWFARSRALTGSLSIVLFGGTINGIPCAVGRARSKILVQLTIGKEMADSHCKRQKSAHFHSMWMHGAMSLSFSNYPESVPRATLAFVGQINESRRHTRQVNQTDKIQINQSLVQQVGLKMTVHKKGQWGQLEIK